MSNCFFNVTIIPCLVRRNSLYCKDHAKVSTVQRPGLVKFSNRNPLNSSNSLAHVTPILATIQLIAQYSYITSLLLNAAQDDDGDVSGEFYIGVTVQ